MTPYIRVLAHDRATHVALSLSPTAGPRPGRRSWAPGAMHPSAVCEQHAKLGKQRYSHTFAVLQVPAADNYFTALNSAVFSDGSFVYVPKGVRSPMELSTYFRINAANTGQFERTIIIAEEGAYVSYLEGCTAPAYDENQLHAAVVELSTAADAEIKYSTVQNWYAGDEEGKGGIFNFVTKRGLCHGARSKISWTQVRGTLARIRNASRPTPW